MQKEDQECINFMNMLYVACHMMPHDAYTIDYFPMDPKVIHKITIVSKGYTIKFERDQHPCIIMWRSTKRRTGVVKILNGHVALIPENAHKIIATIHSDRDPYRRSFWK